jgi:Zn-dependent protease with chaperone function
MVQPVPARNEWEPPDEVKAPGGKAFVALVFAAWVTPVAVAAVAAGEVFIWLAVAFFLATIAFIAGQRRFLLSATVTATADDHPRFVNIARGLAGDLGITVPRLLVARKPGPNAFVAPGALAVTHDLLQGYTRTELEAVVAHCLVRLRDGGLGWALAASAIPGGERWATPQVDRALDARAAAVTRYPPALASAIRKAEPASGARASLWFVADARSHAPVEERAGELLDL